MNKRLGRKNGTYIFNAVRGKNNEPVKEREPSIQFSKIITLKRDSKEVQFLKENLMHLCNELHKIIIKNDKMFKSIGIQFVQSDLTIRSKSKMLKNPTDNLEELLKNSEQLLHEALEDQELMIRRLGIKVSELSEIQGQNSITKYF